MNSRIGHFIKINNKYWNLRHLVNCSVQHQSYYINEPYVLQCTWQGPNIIAQYGTYGSMHTVETFSTENEAELALSKRLHDSTETSDIAGATGTTEYTSVSY